MLSANFLGGRRRIGVAIHLDPVTVVEAAQLMGLFVARTIGEQLDDALVNQRRRGTVTVAGGVGAGGKRGKRGKRRIAIASEPGEVVARLRRTRGSL